MFAGISQYKPEIKSVSRMVWDSNRKDNGFGNIGHHTYLDA